MCLTSNRVYLDALSKSSDEASLPTSKSTTLKIIVSGIGTKCACGAGCNSFVGKIRTIRNLVVLRLGEQW